MTTLQGDLKNFLYLSLGHCSTSDGGNNTHAINKPEDSIGFIEGGIVSQEMADFICGESALNLFEKYQDIKYKSRKCFVCPREINFHDFWNRNKHEMSLEQLEKIWDSPYVELFCCSCFRKEKLFEEIQKKREWLLNKSKRICEKFGFDLIHDKP